MDQFPSTDGEALVLAQLTVHDGDNSFLGRTRSVGDQPGDDH